MMRRIPLVEHRVRVRIRLRDWLLSFSPILKQLIYDHWGCSGQNRVNLQ